jgi:hypothetical protein
MDAQNLPRPYLFSLDAPIVYFNGRLLQAAAETAGEDNYVEMYKKRYTLEEVITPGKLDELYFRHNSQVVEQIQGRFIRQNFDGDFLSRESLMDDLRRNQVLSLIVEKILPVITSDRLNEKIEGIINSEPHAEQAEAPRQLISRNSQPAISPHIRRELNQVKRKLTERLDAEYSGNAIDLRVSVESIDSRIRRYLQASAASHPEDTFQPLAENSALQQAVHGNFMLLNDKVYSLATVKEFLSNFADGISREFFRLAKDVTEYTEPSELIRLIRDNRGMIEHKYYSRIKNKIKSTILKINEKYYVPLLQEQVSRLDEVYLKQLEMRIKLDAIEHNDYQTALLEKLSKERQKLEDVISRSSYEKNNAGFIKKDGEYYVYVKTPAYALKSPHIRSSERRYIEFAPVRIGVRIRYVSRTWNESPGRNNGIYEISKPLVIDGHRHPFVGQSAPYSSICLGSYDLPHDYNRLPPEKQATLLLDQGKKTLMMGYRTGSNPYPQNKLTTDNWSSWITKEEVERKGLVVLNDFSRGE